MKAAVLKWDFQQGLYFAHAPEGLWTIEQLRGRFLVTLDLIGTRKATQDMGSYKTLVLAKKAVDRAHRALRSQV